MAKLLRRMVKVKFEAECDIYIYICREQFELGGLLATWKIAFPEKSFYSLIPLHNYFPHKYEEALRNLCQSILPKHPQFQNGF